MSSQETDRLTDLNVANNDDIFQSYETDKKMVSRTLALALVMVSACGGGCLLIHPDLMAGLTEALGRLIH